MITYWFQLHKQTYGIIPNDLSRESLLTDRMSNLFEHPILRTSLSWISSWKSDKGQILDSLSQGICKKLAQARFDV